MQIKGLMLDPSSKLPIVILRDDDSRYLLPIWIGVFEANAIALRVEEIETPRPMTHDLLQAALTEVGVEVEKVVISDLQDNTFYALISPAPRRQAADPRLAAQRRHRPGAAGRRADLRPAQGACRAPSRST